MDFAVLAFLEVGQDLELFLRLPELVHVRHGGRGGRSEGVVVLCALGVRDHGEHVIALLGCEW